ncbi:MAG: cation diffusion facilitator family transporter [Candidatus Margulisiibacteriota bacterium]
MNSSKENSLGISFALNFLTSLIQIAGGILSGSLSLISDSLHNLSDSIALIISLFALKLSIKENTETKTFGYKRAEILAALFNACMLIVVSLFLFKEAFVRLASPQAINSPLMLIIACVGLVANLISVFILKGHAHSDMNIRTAYLHLFSDFLSSIAVIFGAVLIYFFKVDWIDPVLTILIGLYVLKGGYQIIEESIHILMQNVPKGVNLEEIRAKIEEFSQVKDLHHAHLWSVTEREIHFEAHINLVKDIAVSETCRLNEEINKMLEEKFSISHATLQFEFEACKGISLIKN